MPQIAWLNGTGEVLDGSDTSVSLQEGLALLIQGLFQVPFEAWDGVQYLGALRHAGYLRVVEGVALDITPQGLHLLAHHFPTLSHATLERLHAPERAFRQHTQARRP